MVPLLFDGRHFRATAEGALFWPEQGALLVADLHLEKASWFGRHGQMLPPYDSIETLDRVAALVARTGAKAIWCLGDSFHDADAVARLSPSARARLEALVARLDWLWITGNHDADATPGIGRCVNELCVDGIWLRHEARAGEVAGEISGHFHPKWTVHVRGQRVSRRCFVGTARKLVLPAFGSLTGGLDAAHPALLAAMGGPAAQAQALIPAGDRLLRFAVG